MDLLARDVRTGVKSLKRFSIKIDSPCSATKLSLMRQFTLIKLKLEYCKDSCLHRLVLILLVKKCFIADACILVIIVNNHQAQINEIQSE